MLILSLIVVGCTEDEKVFEDSPLPFEEPDPWGECFVAGTQISMEHGDSLSIEDIQVGDYVQSMDIDSNELVSKPVLWVTQSSATSLYSLTTRSSKIEGVTPYHPFYIPTRNEWTRVEDLKIGDPLVVVRDDHTYIEKIKHIALHQFESPRNVYNFMVASPQNNYFAESLLVHNKDPYNPTNEIYVYITSPSNDDVLVEGEQTFEATIQPQRELDGDEEIWNIDVTWVLTMNGESTTIEECSQTVTIDIEPEEPASIECVISLVLGEGTVEIQAVGPEVSDFAGISFTVIPPTDTGIE